MADQNYCSPEILAEFLNNFEQNELDGLATAETYSQQLAIYLVQNDLANAKFLWKRIPEDVKSMTDELQKIWAVGCKMWLKDYAGIYSALKQEWSEMIKPLMLALEGNIRDHLFELVQKAYTSIHLDKFCLFLGMSPESALEVAKGHNWPYDEATKMLTPVKAETGIKKGSDITIRSDKQLGSPKLTNDPGQKLPLKRFEPAIYRFTKIAVPTDLDRLERHKYNIEKYIKWKNWSKFDVERINAERTIKQLHANIQDINTIRGQVAESEVAEFDNKIKVVKTKALQEISSLQDLIKSVKDDRDDNDGSVGKLNLSPTTSNADFPLVTDSGKNFLPVSETETKSTPKPNLLRFDVALRTFTRITIPMALERLRMHCVNMEKYYGERMWRELNAEQVNAGITVQHLKTSIQDMEMTRRQVPLSGLAEFDKRVGPSYDKALAAIDSFMKFQSKYKPAAAITVEETMKEDDSLGMEMHGKLLNEELAPDEETVHSWDDLQKSLVELNDLIHEFSHLVHEQQSAVNTIESNIEHAQVNVHEATHTIGHAAKIQGMLLPAIGAVVGGVVGGPVGLLAGFKAATLLTAVGGGVIGYKTASYVKNKRDEAVDSELEKLTDGNNPNDVYGG